MVNVKSRREEYSDATRQALVDSAVERFAERGYAGASLDEIAAAARVTKGALYHHFDGKQALFEAALRQLAAAAIEELATAAGEADNAWDAALIGLDRYLERCRDPAYGRIVIQEGPIALGFARWLEYEREHAWGFTESLMRALMDEGFIEPMPLESTTKVVFGMLNAACLAITQAPESDQGRVTAEMRAVLRRIVDGLRLPN